MEIAKAFDGVFMDDKKLIKEMCKSTCFCGAESHAEYWIARVRGWNAYKPKRIECKKEAQ